MRIDEMASLSTKAREDGKRLFGVCDFLYKLAIFGVWVIAILGGCTSLYAFSHSAYLALGVALITAAVCFINYMIAVLTTHVAKVLVHTSFATVGLLELMSEEKFRGDTK